MCLAAAALRAADPPPGERFRARTLTYPYTEGSIFAMPREKIQLAMTAPATRLYSIDAPQGAVIATGPNTWTWEAPVKPGLYPLKVKNPAGNTVVDFSAFVMVPSTDVRRGMLNAFEIGSYPDSPLKGHPIYIAPKGSIACSTSAWCIYSRPSAHISMRAAGTPTISTS